ncbi:amelogenin-like [Diorhabda sublineata]|uniref:amelogenin-like n=1 Tax=Diorhabda sublineata TaxID=1163346 RepID=UPI0024E07AAF|nr:amelogenin-like [Diorhabda sublineata]
MNQMYPPIHMLGPFDPQVQYMPSNFLPSAPGYQTEPPQYNRDQWPQPATHHPQGHQQFSPVYPIIPTQLQVMQSMQYMQQVPPPPQPLM